MCVLIIIGRRANAADRPVVADKVTVVEQALIAIKILSGTNREVRTGAVLAKNGSVLSVRWHDDGHEEDVRVTGTTLWAVEGSLRHRSFVEPDALRAWMEADPMALVVQLLREVGRPLTGRAAKEQLRLLGLDAGAVDKAWNKVQGGLSKRGDITAKKGVYKWAGPAEDRGASVTFAAEGSEAPAKDASSVDELEPMTAGQQNYESGGPGMESAAAGIVSAAIGIIPAADESTLLGRPLRTGVGLGRLTDKEVERLLADVPPEGAEFVRTLLLTRPQKMTALDVHDGVPAVTSTILDAASAEIRGTDDDELRAAATWLLRRAVDAPEAPAAGPLVRLASLVAAGARQRELDTLERALGDLGGRRIEDLRSEDLRSELEAAQAEAKDAVARAEHAEAEAAEIAARYRELEKRLQGRHARL